MKLARSLAIWLVLAALPASVSAQAWLDAPRVLAGTGTEILGIADLDGDSDEDLLVVQRTGSYLTAFHVLFRTAADEYTAGPVTSIPMRWGYHFQLGDLTGDGLAELVFSVADDQDGFRLYRNLGGTFAAPTFFPVQPTSTAVYALAVGDRDGDGGRDLAELENVSGGFSLTRWWSWDGSTLVPGAAEQTIDYAFWLLATDLTGEGRSDLVTGADGSTVLVAETLPGGEAGAFAAVETGHDAYISRQVVAGDVDGDGDEDLLALWREYLGGLNLKSLAVIDNLGGGALTGLPEQEIALGSGLEPRRAHLADWDVDGDLDLLLVSRTVRILENRGRGRFRQHDNVPLGSEADGAGVSDLNGDGFPDFAGARGILYGDGSLEPLPQAWISGGHVRAVDVEGDGDLDVVNTEKDMWINDGAGAFQKQVLPAPAPAPGTAFRDYLAAGDFDGDGRLDFLVSRLGPGPGQLITRFLRGTITGDFQDAGPASPLNAIVGGYNIFWLPPADIDGDSDLDVAKTGGWWENDGTGFFPTFHAAWSGMPRALADVDGDLELDVLTLEDSGATTTLTLQRNQGGGVFAAELLVTESVTGSLADRAYLVDLDEDGDREAVIGTYAGSRSILVFDNTGGSFGGPLVLPGQDNAQDVLAFSDVDGDGRLDIIGAPGGANGYPETTWLVWRNAPAGFEAPRAYVAFGARLGGEIDQDGDVDVLGYRPVRNQHFRGRGDGLARQYGAGTRGSGEAVPVLGALGPLRPGSAGAALRIVRGRGGSPAVVRAGTGRAHAAASVSGGRNLLIRGPFLQTHVLLGGAAGAPGEGTAELSLTPATLALAGQTLWLQALVLDSGARGGVATSNGLEVVLGL